MMDTKDKKLYTVTEKKCGENKIHRLIDCYKYILV